MEELIKYFQANEARIAALEARITALEAQVAAQIVELTQLKNRPAPEPQVVEKIVEVEKPVEVIKEVIVEKPVVVAAPVAAPEEPEETKVPEIPETPEEPVVEEEPEIIEESEPTPEPEPEPSLFTEEPVSPKAAIYGKPVEDIRQAISLGDRFLYQRELFSQNAELMQRTLTELNALGSFDEAVAYINTHFEWDTESNSYQQFLVALHRRFG